MSDATEPDRQDPLAVLRAQFVELVGEDTALDGIVRRHRERHRRYHTLDHVVAVVRHVGDLSRAEPVADLGAVVAAAWYHDAVYEPRSPANERASARLAVRDLQRLGWEPRRTESVAAMIDGTAHHWDPVDHDTSVLFDADLAILGSAPDDYADYVAAVRAEYSHVDDESWRSGRADVLSGFLDRPSIFATATAVARWEASARGNLAAELEDLSS